MGFIFFGFILPILADISICGVMFRLQYIEKLPERRKFDPQDPGNRFLYFQDYSIFWGDVIGLALVDVSFFLISLDGGIPSWVVGFSSILGLVVAFVLHKLWTGEKHVPDWAYRLGVSSWAGKVHTVYFGTQIAMASILIMTLALKLAWPLEFEIFLPYTPAIIGGVYYGFMWLRDVKSGRM